MRCCLGNLLRSIPLSEGSSDRGGLGEDLLIATILKSSNSADCTINVIKSPFKKEEWNGGNTQHEGVNTAAWSHQLYTNTEGAKNIKQIKFCSVCLQDVADGTTPQISNGVARQTP